MARDTRWEDLLALLADRRTLSVAEVAETFGVSEATARRDLDALAAQQMLRRTRGGAVAHGVGFELPLRYKESHRAGPKTRIGTAVAALIAPGEVVGLTGGTTTTEVARALAVRPDLAQERAPHPDTPSEGPAGSAGRGTGAGATQAEHRTGGPGGPALTVVTTALNIAAELAIRPRFKMVVTGGVARPHSYELTGPLAAESLAQLAVDTAVLGVNAFDPSHGAWTHHEDEAGVNRLLCGHAGRVIVAADSSKLGLRSFARICPTSQVDALVTDTDAPPELVGRFRGAGITVITA